MMYQRLFLLFVSLGIVTIGGVALSLDEPSLDEPQRYIVLTDGSVDESTLDSFDIDIVFSYSIIDGMAIEMTPSVAEQVASVSGVEQVIADIPVSLPVDTGEQRDDDSRSWNGSGRVAVLDTGVDDGHADLDDVVIRETDVRSGQNDPMDHHGHGTHVASIVAGSGDGDDAYTGVAPGADILNYKVLDDSGQGRMSTIIEGIDQADDRASILVMSLGANVEDCDGTDPLSKAVNNAASNGVSVVVAAGNEGPEDKTITAPGCATHAYTVGSSDENQVSSFSSRGPTADGRTKPDIVAPGEDIIAAEAGTASDYTSKSGTSMAAPYVAGAIAVLQSQYDGDQQRYREALLETTSSLNTGENTEGHGRIDIDAAKRYLNDTRSGQTTTDDETGETYEDNSSATDETNNQTDPDQENEAKNNESRSSFWMQVLTQMRSFILAVLP